jgi:hypothetical protein
MIWHSTFLKHPYDTIHFEEHIKEFNVKNFHSGFSIILLITTLAASSLACNLGGRLQKTIPTPTSTPVPVPVTTEAVRSLETEVSSAVATVQSGGPLSIQITEGQATAAAVMALQQVGENRVTDLQIHFRDGQIQVAGTASQSGVTLPLDVVLVPRVQQGKPTIQILSAQVGPFPVPQQVLDQMTGQFDQLIQQQLDENGTNLVVQTITVDNGTMTVVAQKP